MNTRIIIILLLFLNLSLRLIVLSFPFEQIDNSCILDDSYVSMKISQNIAEGKGMTYSGEYTSGFQPLLVFIMVPFFITYPDDNLTPVYFILIILSLLNTLSLYFIFKLISLFTKNKIVPTIISFIYILSPYIIRISLNGLETSLSFFFVVLIFYLVFKYNENLNKKFLFLAGLLLGLSYLARIDNVFLMFSITIFVGIKHYGEKKLINILWLFGGILIILIPWFMYLYHFTGDIYPVSGSAVRNLSLAHVEHNPGLSNWYFPVFVKSIGTIVSNNIVAIAIILYLIIYSFISKNKSMVNTLKGIILEYYPVIIFSFLIFVSYTFYIFTHWYFNRYFFPLVVISYIIAGVFLDNYFKTIKIKNVIISGAIFIIIIFVVNISRPNFQKLFFQSSMEQNGYFQISKWTGENFKKGEIIGALQTGGLSYFNKNLKIYNLDGVVNKDAYIAAKEKKLIEYIKSKNINYLILWDIDYEYIKTESVNFKQQDLILVKKIEGIHTLGYDWYLYKVNYY